MRPFEDFFGSSFNPIGLLHQRCTPVRCFVTAVNGIINVSNGNFLSNSQFRKLLFHASTASLLAVSDRLSVISALIAFGFITAKNAIWDKLFQIRKRTTFSPHSRLSVLVARVGLEPHDLQVMSLASYQLLHPAIKRTVSSHKSSTTSASYYLYFSSRHRSYFI